ncbi:MAG: LytR/AlgR family response regulator transcription factor [Bacteroidia bacterium]
MNNKLNVLIVDDEAHARAALRGIIELNFSDVNILAEVSSVPDAVKAIHKFKPDVVLLDIEMPGYLGVDLLDFFNPQDIDFSIIFVTAYNDYALKAFDIAAVDYLLKPTRVEHLERAFNRIRNLSNKNYENYFALKQNLEKRRFEKIAFQTADGLLLSETNDILYLKADSAYTHVFFKNGNKITITKTLQEFNSLEDTGNFMRINRSYIINLNCVEKVSKKDGGYVIMNNGEEISASLEKRQLLYERFKDFIF